MPKNYPMPKGGRPAPWTPLSSPANDNRYLRPLPDRPRVPYKGPVPKPFRPFGTKPPIPIYRIAPYVVPRFLPVVGWALLAIDISVLLNEWYERAYPVPPGWLEQCYAAPGIRMIFRTVAGPQCDFPFHNPVGRAVHGDPVRRIELGAIKADAPPADPNWWKTNAQWRIGTGSYQLWFPIFPWEWFQVRGRGQYVLPWPALDPFLTPIGQPVPTPQPLPFPGARPHSPPWPEAPQRGPQPGPGSGPAPGPGGGTDPGGNTNPGGNTTSPPEDPPGPKTKERKLRLTDAGVYALISQIINLMTESADFINALYDSLPEDVRLFYGTRTKKWMERDATPQDKFQRLYDNFDKIDWAAALYNLAANQLEDTVFGKVSKELSEKLSPYFGRGATWGPAI